MLNALKKFLGGVLALGIALLLLDGLVDVTYHATYGLRSYIKNFARAESVEAQNEQVATGDKDTRDLMPFLDFETRYVAGQGSIPGAVNRGEMVVRNDGRRMAPGEAVERTEPHVIVLGSSQVFGIFNAAAETLPANLDRLLPGHAVMNYAVPGQHMAENMVYLQRLLRSGVSVDAVLLVAGPLDVFYHCVYLPTQKSYLDEKYNARLVNVLHRIEELYRPRAVDYDCGEGNPGVTSVVDRVRGEIRGAVATAHALGLPIAVVVPPSPYGGKSDVSNLVGADLYQAYARGMDVVFAEFSRRLHDEPIESVHDLSGAFQGMPPMFFDEGGHIFDEGQRVLAKEIARTVDFAALVNVRP